MQFSAADITAMIGAMGQTVTIGTVSKTGVFSTGPREVVRNDARVWTDQPTLLLSEADAATVTRNSTIITIGSVTYQAYEKTPDGSGFVELDLTRDY
jgi:hypothetical protein